jgi:hypothetical protein
MVTHWQVSPVLQVKPSVTQGFGIADPGMKAITPEPAEENSCTEGNGVVAGELPDAFTSAAVPPNNISLS